MTSDGTNDWEFASDPYTDDDVEPMHPQLMRGHIVDSKGHKNKIPVWVRPDADWKECHQVRLDK